MHLKRFSWVSFGVFAAVSLTRCDCGDGEDPAGSKKKDAGGTNITRAFCEGQGLEYRETSDGQGYCYGGSEDGGVIVAEGGVIIDQAFCENLGLEYRVTPGGVGYCFEDLANVDCSTAGDGAECDDENACTFNDACSNGTCGGTPLAGYDDNNPCTQDSCDPATGAVAHDPIPLNGTGCDDNDVCSNNDICSQGICSGDYTVDLNGNPIDDGDACTKDSCDQSGQRRNEPYTPQEAATLGLGGITIEDVANPCLEYACTVGGSDAPHMDPMDQVDCADPAAGRTNGDCVNWICQAGTCAGIVDHDAVQTAPISDGEDLHPNCRMRECNTSTGNVVYVADPSTVEDICDDNNGCTFTDQCQMDGTCMGSELAHGTRCDDGNPCSIDDYCHINECRPGMDLLDLAESVNLFGDPDGLNYLRDPEEINDDPCKYYFCDPDRGVVIAYTSNGTVCDDGNPCTATSACQEGLCVGARDTSNDGNACERPGDECHEGYCDKGVCINYQPVTDNRTCTGANPCKVHQCGTNGACDEVSNLPEGTLCDDTLGECTVGLCNSSGACLPNTTSKDGLPCIDGDPRCNQPTCNSGVCNNNPVAEATPCTLTEADVGASNMPCNEGLCTGNNIMRMCFPTPTNDEGSCDDNNPCNGEDWCESGSCKERYTSTDPTDQQPPHADCDNTPGNCYDNATPTVALATVCEVDGKSETVGRCKYTGECIEISQVIDDDNECTIPVWTESGQLTMEPVPNDTPCNEATINPCAENHGVCIDGACHNNPMPNGSSCDLAAIAVPTVDDLPMGHQVTCYDEVCIEGQCVIDTSLRDGTSCDDGEATCTGVGSCQSGACTVNNDAQGYGETCSPTSFSGIVDISGQPIAGKDADCWAVFECNESGSCSVAVAEMPAGTACDYDLNGDTCDGQCTDGICEQHNWTANTPNLTCDDANPCTVAECDGQGDCKSGTDANRPDGEYPGCDRTTEATHQCLTMECTAGVCDAVIPSFPKACDDANSCTTGDICNNGNCDPGIELAEDTPCELAGADADTDCQRAVCNANAQCQKQVDEPDGSPCNTEDACSQWECTAGTCEPRGAAWQLEDGTNCDTNSIPCDEGCLDIDGPLGDEPSACRPFSNYMGLLTAKNMASNGDHTSANGTEEDLCRAMYDPGFDPADPTSGNSCTRWICYYGACQSWNDRLPEGLVSAGGSAYGSGPGLAENPTEDATCRDDSPCTANATCHNNVCTSYHHQNDGVSCGGSSCVDGYLYSPTCESGACVDREMVYSSCDRGTDTCQANDCAGEGCAYSCSSTWFDYANVFEDISSGGENITQDLVSPMDTSVTCGNFLPNTALSEERRMACDDGSVLIDLTAAPLAFTAPRGATADEGYWFFNRRYRYISVSANGTVIFHKDHPSNLSQREDTMFVSGNVGGSTYDPDANDSPGDPVNNGENAAQVRVFRDDLTFVSDIDEEDIPTNPETPYGSFSRVGSIHITKMTGPSYSAADDYLIVQWTKAAFFGCADGARPSRMTVQMKWWPWSGRIVFAYPKSGNDDGTQLLPNCLPERQHGVNANIGLYDENGSPSVEIGNNTWMIVNNSGPASDSFDAYYMFWPTDRPITQYDWRTHEYFDDITVYDPARGDSTGYELEELADCDSCCQRVDFDQPTYFRGQLVPTMYVCADGYLHFQSSDDRYFTPESLPVLADEKTYTSTANSPQVSPFWADLDMESSPLSKVYYLEYEVDGNKRIVVQWDRVDYGYETNVDRSLPYEDQERGEALCSNNSDNDNDGAVDCDDSSCACAHFCGGEGCGLTFQAIIHADLNHIEFRYLNSEAEYQHAEGSMRMTGLNNELTGVAIGFGVRTVRGLVGSEGIDLMDGLDGGTVDMPIGGSRLTRHSLHPADVDEMLPGTHRSVLLPANWYLNPYDQVPYTD